MFSLCKLHTLSLYTQYNNKLDYKPDRNSFPAFFIFHSCIFSTNLKIIFLKCFNTITVTNLLLDQPDRQTNPGTTENNIKLHLIDIQEYKNKQNFPQPKFGNIHNILLWVYLQSAQYPLDGLPRSLSRN